MASLKSLLLNKDRAMHMAKSYGGANDLWKPALTRRLSPAAFPLLYESTATLGGGLSVPHLVTEQQNDHIRGRGSGLATMFRLQRHAQHLVEVADDERGVTTRLILNRSKKWGMHNNGDEEYPERKTDSIRNVRNLLAHSGARDLAAFLEAVHASGQKLDDLTDAFGLALEAACELYAKGFKALGLGKKPLQLGTPNPTLGTVRVLGIDPGTINFAFCLLEVTGFEPGTHETYTLSDGVTIKEHFLSSPIFRVLHWEVVNLETDQVKGHFALSADALATAPYYSRNVVPERMQDAPKLARRKRKRTTDANEEGRNKRARLDHNKRTNVENAEKEEVL